MNHASTSSRRASSADGAPRAGRRLPRVLNAVTAACLLLAVALSAGSARAAPVTYVGSVSSPQAFNNNNTPCLSPARAGDSSGLSIGPIVDGVTPWAVTSTALHSNGGCTFGVATPNPVSVQFTLDLGTVRTVDMLGFWGTDVGGFNNALQNLFALTADNQATAGNPQAAALGVFSAAGGQLGNTSMQSFAFSPVPARYLHLDFFATTGRVFIGELAAREANAVPEPGGLALAGVSLLALALVQRRRSR